MLVGVFFMQKKVVLEEDGEKKDVTFRKILLSKCQKEFENEKSVEKRIHERLEELSSKGLSVSMMYTNGCNVLMTVFLLTTCTTYYHRETFQLHVSFSQAGSASIQTQIANEQSTVAWHFDVCSVVFILCCLLLVSFFHTNK